MIFIVKFNNRVDSIVHLQEKPINYVIKHNFE